MDGVQLGNYIYKRIRSPRRITQLCALLIRAADTVGVEYLRQYLLYLVYNYDYSIYKNLRSLFQHMHETMDLTYKKSLDNRFSYKFVRKL